MAKAMTEPLRPVVEFPTDEAAFTEQDPTTYRDLLIEAGAYRNKAGQLVRKVRRHDGTRLVDGKRMAIVRTEERRVAEAREEALFKGWDYFHPTLGWLRNGFKPEREHPDNVRPGTQASETTYEELPGEESAQPATAKAGQPAADKE
jgi:hypothetical protein